MNIFQISLSYLKSRLIQNLLNLILLSLGIMMITILVSFGNQARTKLTNDSRAIDAVIGAKGSSLQLVLSTIWHIDIPNGNINYHDGLRFLKKSKIKNPIPISLGDSFKGFRIIGTQIDYINLFNAEIEQGKIWSGHMEVVVGANVAKLANLTIGKNFKGVHGLIESGSVHDEKDYAVVGILKKTNSVIDNLILTSLDSVWLMHDHSEANDHNTSFADSDSNHHNHDNHDDHHEKDLKKEVTAFLIKYQNRRSAITFPRYVNQNSNFQAASPAFELAKISRIIGVGENSVMYIGIFLIFISLIGIFVGLLNSVRQRRYDLALFRTLGASRKTVFLVVIIEGMIIVLMSLIIGFLTGNFGLEILGNYSDLGNKIGLKGFTFIAELNYLLLSILLISILICLIPAIKAYRTDIWHMLRHE